VYEPAGGGSEKTEGDDGVFMINLHHMLISK
jgi:hypothetical protein